jgi:hypothetical protein
MDCAHIPTCLRIFRTLVRRTDGARFAKTVEDRLVVHRAVASQRTSCSGLTAAFAGYTISGATLKEDLI